jgi:hypothetical protein
MILLATPPQPTTVMVVTATQLMLVIGPPMSYADTQAHLRGTERT